MTESPASPLQASQPQEPIQTPPAAEPISTSQAGKNSAIAKALSSLALEISKLQSGQELLLQSLSREWQLPDLPAGPHDVSLQLSFALADSTGVLDKSLLVIPLTGMKSPTGLPRAATQAEEAIHALFLRPLMDSLGARIINWCTQAEREGAHVPRSIQGSHMLLEQNNLDDGSN